MFCIDCTLKDGTNLLCEHIVKISFSGSSGDVFLAGEQILSGRMPDFESTSIFYFSAENARYVVSGREISYLKITKE